MRIEDTVDMGNGALPLVVQIETYDTAAAHPFVPGHKIGVRLSVMEKRTLSREVVVEMLEQPKLFFCDVRGPVLKDALQMAIDELRKWTAGFVDVIDSSMEQMRMLLAKGGAT